MKLRVTSLFIILPIIAAAVLLIFSPEISRVIYIGLISLAVLVFVILIKYRHGKEGIFLVSIETSKVGKIELAIGKYTESLQETLSAPDLTDTTRELVISYLMEVAKWKTNMAIRWIYEDTFQEIVVGLKSHNLESLPDRYRQSAIQTASELLDSARKKPNAISLFELLFCIFVLAPPVLVHIFAFPKARLQPHNFIIWNEKTAQAQQLWQFGHENWWLYLICSSIFLIVLWVTHARSVVWWIRYPILISLSLPFLWYSRQISYLGNKFLAFH